MFLSNFFGTLQIAIFCYIVINYTLDVITATSVELNLQFEPGGKLLLSIVGHTGRSDWHFNQRLSVSKGWHKDYKAICSSIMQGLLS